METVKKQTTQETKKENCDSRVGACLEILRELKKKAASEIIQRDLDTTSLLTLGSCFLVECMVMAHEWSDIPYEKFYDDTIRAVRAYFNVVTKNAK